MPHHENTNLPFFMSEEDAIGRAKESIPPRYHDQTWILNGSDLERALNIPVSSAKAFVLVLDSRGEVVARVEGKPSETKVNEVTAAVREIK